MIRSVGRTCPMLLCFVSCIALAQSSHANDNQWRYILCYDRDAAASNGERLRAALPLGRVIQIAGLRHHRSFADWIRVQSSGSIQRSKHAECLGLALTEREHYGNHDGAILPSMDGFCTPLQLDAGGAAPFRLRLEGELRTVNPRSMNKTTVWEVSRPWRHL